MPVTRAQAEAALQQLAEEFAANADQIAAVMGVESVNFEVDDAQTVGDCHPFWTATTRRGTTIHRAGPDGFTVDPCHRSMLAGGGVRLTRAEADAIEGHTWCGRCGGQP